MSTPRIALTMGDVAGVGPEVIADAWTQPAFHAAARPLVIGHPQVLRRAVELRRASVQVVEVTAPREVEPTPRVMPCLRAAADDCLEVPSGKIDARAGEAAYRTLDAAIDLARAGRVDAITTAPLNKAALHCAGYTYPGHTEILAERCGTPNFAMMLYLAGGESQGENGSAAGRGLAVVHVTLHMALRDVFRHVTTQAVLAKIQLAHDFTSALSPVPPRIGVSALNPHAGEMGLFGDEESTIIAPAIDRARQLGIDVTGPFPSDTLMVRAAAGEFDAVVAMIHDQGHIAVKLLGLERAVNVTLGLPIIRTSVAHGTAFDLAWTGRADSGSMVEAVRVAARLARTRAALIASAASSEPA